MNESVKEFVVKATLDFGPEAVLTRQQIQEVVDKYNIGYPNWLVARAEYRVERGKYKLPSLENPTEGPTVASYIPTTNATPDSVMLPAPPTGASNSILNTEYDVAIPMSFTGYVPFGFFPDMKHIIESKMFYPTLVTGLSGNGKTLMIEQCCAESQRECIRINVSIETDQNDLLGGPTLVNGNIEYRDGPVVIAMNQGAICLIDELDRGSNKIMCLQGILEGKPWLNKHTGKIVYPKPGFNIIATANTKGKGSEEGRYLAQILDDALLERFAITIEQEYPSEKIELKIVKNELKKSAKKDDDFAIKLVTWANTIRKVYEEGGIDEIISTRRLTHICRAFAIFGDREKAINLCLNRFDSVPKTAMLDLYKKIDDSLSPQEEDAKENLKFWEQTDNDADKIISTFTNIISQTIGTAVPHASAAPVNP